MNGHRLLICTKCRRIWWGWWSHHPRGDCSYIGKDHARAPCLRTFEQGIKGYTVDEDGVCPRWTDGVRSIYLSRMSPAERTPGYLYANHLWLWMEAQRDDFPRRAPRCAGEVIAWEDSAAWALLRLGQGWVDLQRLALHQQDMRRREAKRRKLAA